MGGNADSAFVVHAKSESTAVFGISTYIFPSTYAQTGGSEFVLTRVLLPDIVNADLAQDEKGREIIRRGVVIYLLA